MAGLFGGTAVLVVGGSAVGQVCPGNVNGDTHINGYDLAIVLANWGACTDASCPCDIDGDGIVEGKDLAYVLSGWGPCPIVPSWATLVEARPDPNVVTDATLRAAISATGYAWRVQDTATGIEMLLVPPGTFMMGCIEQSLQYPCLGNEFPAHQVTLTQPFYLGRYEVTQAQFTARMGFNPSFFQGFPDSPNRPVEQLDVHEMRQFLNSAGMRFPSEAEWEYACRAGTTTAYYNGSNDYNTLDALAWHGGNASEMTHPVGQKLSNRLGLHDMLGNVYEWIEGCPELYPSTPRIDPVDAECPSTPPWHMQSLRGGSWYSYPDPVGNQVRSSVRVNLMCCSTPGPRGTAIGFRVARNP